MWRHREWGTNTSRAPPTCLALRLLFIYASQHPCDLDVCAHFPRVLSEDGQFASGYLSGKWQSQIQIRLCLPLSITRMPWRQKTVDNFHQMEKSNTKTIKKLNTLLHQRGCFLLISPFNKYVWWVYYVPGGVIDNRDIVVNKLFTF